MSFIGARLRKGVSSYSYVLSSDFRRANNRELNTTFVKAINQLCFVENSSWRIHTTPVNENKNISGKMKLSDTFFRSQMYAPCQKKATLSHMKACEELAKLVIFVSSFLDPAMDIHDAKALLKNLRITSFQIEIRSGFKAAHGEISPLHSHLSEVTQKSTGL